MREFDVRRYRGEFCQRHLVIAILRFAPFDAIHRCFGELSFERHHFLSVSVSLAIA